MLSIGCLFSLSLLLIIELSQAKNFTNLVSTLVTLALISSYAAASLSLEFLSAGIILSFASATLVIITLFVSSGYSTLGNNISTRRGKLFSSLLSSSLIAVLMLTCTKVSNSMAFNNDTFVLTGAGLVNWSGISAYGSYSFTVLIHTLLANVYLMEGIIINIILIVAFTAVGTLFSYFKGGNQGLSNTAATRNSLRAWRKVPTSRAL